MSGQGGKRKTNTQRLAAATRQIDALKLRQAGMTYDMIAEKLNFRNRSGAYKAVMAALSKMRAEPGEAVRQIEEGRLDRLQLALWQRAINGELDAIGRILQIMARRAAILGLDKPVRSELSGPDGAPIEIDAITDIEAAHRIAALLERAGARRDSSAAGADEEDMGAAAGAADPSIPE